MRKQNRTNSRKEVIAGLRGAGSPDFSRIDRGHSAIT
jgi:hypothetical protein